MVSWGTTILLGACLFRQNPPPMLQTPTSPLNFLTRPLSWLEFDGQIE
jgi:hypothetical protein